MAFQERFSWVWPFIIDTASAKRASVFGLAACGWCAGATILVVILNLFGARLFDEEVSALFYALVFILVGWGIHKMSRIAAVAALAFYVLERTFMALQYGTSRGLVLNAIVTLFLITSVRATFAYHKYAKEEGETALGNGADHSPHEQPPS